jgi:hypothetical protein
MRYLKVFSAGAAIARTGNIGNICNALGPTEQIDDENNPERPQSRRSSSPLSVREEVRIETKTSRLQLAAELAMAAHQGLDLDETQ